VALKLSDAARNAMLDGLTATIGSGAVLRIYTGTRPATVATAITSQVQLAELALSTPAAPAASGGVLTFSPITQDSAADATGTASWYRIIRGSTAIMDGDVATSGADLNINTTSIVVGGPIQITSFVITAAGA
jgi:hypothetical protein